MPYQEAQISKWRYNAEIAEVQRSEVTAIDGPPKVGVRVPEGGGRAI
jgi:hypothetical protein